MSAMAYGLTFELPFPCPALTSAPPGMRPDVAVIEGPVPLQLPGAKVSANTFDAAPGRFLLRTGPRAARFLIEDGNRITLQRNRACEDPILAFHFLHTVMAALLHQRGYLVLHATAALLPEGATVLTGESGAGKSTVLASLAARGYPMLSDDVTALRLRPDGDVEVVPGPSWIHLCDDAAVQLSPEAATLPRHSWHRMKVAVPITGGISTRPLPFRRLVTLSVHSGQQLRVRQLNGTDKIAALQPGIFMPMLAHEHAERFDLLRATLHRARVTAIERPAGRWMVDEVVQAVLNG